MSNSTENPHSAKSRSRKSKGPQRATIHDVARLAEVSPSTVSLFLRRPNEVSAKLGEKIQAAIDELPYMPNRLAGGLAAANSRTLGVLIPSLSNTFFAATVRAMQEECESAGYSLLIGNTDYSIKQEEKLVRTFLEWSPAGIVLTGKDQSPETIRMLEISGVPVAQMWDIGGRSFGLQVGFDNFNVGVLAAQHLYQGGCRRIVYLGARLEDDIRSNLRAEGYASVMKEHGLPHQIISLPVQFSTHEAGLSIAAALVVDPKIDGVICANDSFALGVLFEAQRRGIKVPDRLSVLGFGDLEFAQSTIPPLTSIRPHRERIGKLAIRHLLARCEAEDADLLEPEVVDVGFELIPRQSTRIVLD